MGARTLGAIFIGGLGLSVGAAILAASSPFTGQYRGIAVAAHVLVIAAPIGAGLYAITRQRASRFGWLLVVAGVAWAPTALAESGDSLLYSIGRVDVWVVEIMLVYLVLAFPSGRLETPTSRALFGFALALFAVFYLPSVLFVDQFPVPNPWTNCRSGCPSNAFMLTGSEPGVVGAVVIPLRDFAYALLTLAVAAVLVRRVTLGTRLTRRMLAPVLAFAIVRMALTGVFILMRRAAPGSDGTQAVGVVALFATPGLAIGFLAGLARWRAFAVGAVRRLATDFVGPPTGPRVRDLLAAAFEDPSLAIIYWAPDPGRWVDAAGSPVAVPGKGSGRAVTEVSDGGKRIAALVHDDALADQPIISEVAGGFALVALQNQRLEAELRSSLRDLRDSRARIVSAADKERQRIERDLHDGAQQRLVAVGIKLELAREHADSDPNNGSELLREIGKDVDDALGEVRALAHGVYPSLLADRGLAAALRHVAESNGLKTTVTIADLGRYSQEIEGAIYFCCLEALQNAAKHADGATGVALTLAEDEDGQLSFEVRDDGSGLARAATGAGLTNMRDRIAAVGGSLSVEASPDGGARVRGHVPLGPVELTPELESLLRRATEALDDCFGIFGAVRDQRGSVVDFLVEHVNEAACLDLGLPREGEIGRTLGELVPGYKDSEAFRWHRHVLAGNQPMSREDLSYTGSLEDASHLKLAYDVRGASLGGGRLVLSWRDITKRKRTELDLRLQSLVLARAAEGVCLIRSSDAVIVYANPRYAEIFGYAPGELDGRPVSVLNSEEHPGEAVRRAREIIKVLGERGEASFEIRMRRKDGTSIWTEGRAVGFEHPEYGKVWVSVQQRMAQPNKAVSANGDGPRPLAQPLRGL